MKNRNLLLSIVTIAVLLLTLGGCTKMTQPLSPTKDDQIAFLKKNEALMTTYIKSISDDSPNKITSVTYDWSSVIETMSDPSTLFPKYDSLNISVYVNNDPNQGLGIWIQPNNFDKLEFVQYMGVAGTNSVFFDKYFVNGEPWKEWYHK